MKKRRISRNPKNGNGPKYQKSFEVVKGLLIIGSTLSKQKYRFSFDT